MKILILGHARHGKDTLAELLEEYYGIKYKSSSQVASDIFIFNMLKDAYGYKTPEECFQDRINHRAEWHQLICNYNLKDKARLAKNIIEHADCYVGMRDSAEVIECENQELFNIIVWVDASGRLGEEKKDSFNIDRKHADMVIENNETLEQFKTKTRKVFDLIFKKGDEQ